MAGGGGGVSQTVKKRRSCLLKSFRESHTSGVMRRRLKENCSATDKRQYEKLAVHQISSKEEKVQLIAIKF